MAFKRIAIARSKRDSLGLVVAGIALLTSACSERAREKVVVSGEVTYQGQAVSNGDILFYPSGGTAGPVSGASIVDGRYRADGKGGVPLGKHRVEIRAYRGGKADGVAAQASNSAFESSGAIREQYLPPNFNDTSTLSVTIDGAAQPAVQDFHLSE